MDEACKLHDIVYSQTKDITERHKADKVFEESASKRLKSQHSNMSEKMAAFGVKRATRTKRKMGMGIKKKGGVLTKRFKKK